MKHAKLYKARVSFRVKMATLPHHYELHVFGPHCKKFHDTSVTIPIEESFDLCLESSFYTMQDFPRIVQVALSQEFRCTKTGELLDRTIQIGSFL